MQFFDITLPTPAANLAFDEALLVNAQEAADNNPDPANEIENHSRFECLRIWESTEPFVVLGSSSHYKTEARIEECTRLGIPVLRRASGGAAIVTGPGCMMYAVVLSYARKPKLRAIDASHQFVMQRLAASIARYAQDVRVDGISDLVRDEKKFSGNALRCKRDFLLYHGTLLYDFPIEMIGRCLGTPPRMPEYREKREHGSFVANLTIERDTLRKAVCEAFEVDGEPREASATSQITDWPRESTEQLARDKYSQANWTERF